MPVAGGGQTATATIANAASQSGEVDLEGLSLQAIVMPAAWTAANLTFLASDTSGGTFNPVHDDAGAEVTVTAAAARAIGLDAVSRELDGLRYIKVRSGTTGVPVAQGAERILSLVLRGVS